MKILSIGDLIWDIYSDNACIGGATFNFSAHAAKLGAEVYLISAVGDDELGRLGIEYAGRYGIKTDFMQVNNYETGKTIVKLDEYGNPTYNVLRNVSYDNIKIDDVICRRISLMDFDALYFGTLIQRLASAKAVRLILDNCSFKEIFCDVNLREGCYSYESVSNCLRHATVLKISTEEEPLIRGMDFYNIPVSIVGDVYYREVSAELCRLYSQIKVVIFTMGDRGSVSYEKSSGKSYYMPAVPTRVISTVGAGDSYCAAWLTAWYSSKTIPEAMRHAAQLSSFVVAHKDAIP